MRQCLHLQASLGENHARGDWPPTSQLWDSERFSSGREAGGPLPLFPEQNVTIHWRCFWGL